MAELAPLTAPHVARAIPVRRPRRLLDLGGGPGGYAIAMCRRHPELQATILDLEAAVEHGRVHVERVGMAARVQHRVGARSSTISVRTGSHRHADGRAPRGALHALSGGRTYTADEVSGWLREAGFERIRVRRRPWLPGAMLLTVRA